MIKRLLISGLAGFVAFFVSFWVLLYFEHKIPYDAIDACIGLCVILGLITAVVTFLKVKFKNTVIEDIIINKAKIIKAEQEKRLKALKENQ